MWPKALAQLVELAPHITRLLPMADRFLKDKAAGDDSTRRALAEHRLILEGQRSTLEGMEQRLRAEIGQVASSQSNLQNKALTDIQREVSELESHLTTTRADALAAKVAAESIDSRIRTIESRQARLNTLVMVALALLAAILIVLAVPVLRGR